MTAWSTADVNGLTARTLWRQVKRVQFASEVEHLPWLKQHDVYLWFLHYEVGLQLAQELGVQGDALQVSVRSGRPTRPKDPALPAVFLEGSATDVSVWVGTTLDARMFGPSERLFQARIYCPKGDHPRLKREGPWLVIPTER